MLYPQESETRELKSLDGLWRLCFDSERRGIERRFFEAFPDARAIDIAVPASINEQVADRAQYLSLDWVWYQTWFRVSGTWRGRRVFLRFGAVAQRADVYVNGQLLGSHEGGYTPFEFELTQVAAPGTVAQLVLRVDSLLTATTVPQGGLDPAVGGVASYRAGNNPNVHWDAFPFLGIHRPVVLYSTEAVRMTRLKVDTVTLQGDKATLRAQVTVQGATRVRVRALGVEAAADVHDCQAQLELALAGIEPWSPQCPRLYQLEFAAESATGNDVYRLSFGIRTLRVDGAQLLLNGEPVSLRGFGKHEDVAVVGRGLSLPHLVKDLNLLRWVGANSLRTSHYPYAEELLQQADRHGILVIDEAAANTLSLRAVGDAAARAELWQRHREQIDELVTRDYNYACVIAWSLGNECETDVESDDYFGKLVQHAKSLDSTRPVTFVINTAPQTELAAGNFDLICVNVYPSWYSDCGNLDGIEAALDQTLNGFWRKYGKPILITEFGADAIAGMHSELPLMWSEEYQAEMIERVLDAAAKHPFVMGAQVWNFADFKVGQHPGRASLNHKGVFTRERTPKLAAHALRRRWAKL